MDESKDEQNMDENQNKKNMNDIQNEQNMDANNTNSLNGLFSCPETQCLSTFTRYGNLLHHLDIGIHQSNKISARLSDRSIMEYSKQIQTKSSDFRQTKGAISDKNQNLYVKRGWALQSKREVKRFSET